MSLNVADDDQPEAAPPPTAPRNVVLQGDAFLRLHAMPAGFVDCVITSPPYFRMRDYGVLGQIGVEQNIDAWVQNLRIVVRQLARVLKPTGSLWLNLGDRYAAATSHGAPAKSLLLGPERLLLALAADGWLVRNKIIWAKANPMPESVTDRLSSKHEVIYLLTRQRQYFFDLNAIRERHTSHRRADLDGTCYEPGYLDSRAGQNHRGIRRHKNAGTPGHPLGKNPGDVWKSPTAVYRGAHFATFPESLIERPLRATCPMRLCGECGSPWRTPAPAAAAEPTCSCGGSTIPGLVLDPFFGSGTVGLTAETLGRNWLGIEINPAYVRLANQRLLVARDNHPRRQP